jgi:two-component system chemotaxis response regulator CheY
MILQRLRQAGCFCTVREASDGEQAYALIKAQNPDVVLSDWHMPNMTGPELLRLMRASHMATPFFFVTASATARMDEEAALAGAQGVIDAGRVVKALEALSAHACWDEAFTSNIKRLS